MIYSTVKLEAHSLTISEDLNCARRADSVQQTQHHTEDTRLQNAYFFYDAGEKKGPYKQSHTYHTCEAFLQSGWLCVS